jgi:hypothetical protein
MYKKLKCPECGFDAWVKAESQRHLCGNCAGDCGRDVKMEVVERRDSRPTAEELASVEALDV